MWTISDIFLCIVNEQQTPITMSTQPSLFEHVYCRTNNLRAAIGVAKKRRSHGQKCSVVEIKYKNPTSERVFWVVGERHVYFNA